MTKIITTRKWTFSLTLIVAIAGATLFGGFYGSHLLGAPSQGDLQKRLREYTDLIAAVTSNSADDIGTDKVVYSSIDGMLRTLDPHTSFLEPKEYADMQDRQKGSFYGLGILVTKRNDQVTVITPLEGTPAARLGIRAGDVISEVEGVSTDDLPLDDVVVLLGFVDGHVGSSLVVNGGTGLDIGVTHVQVSFRARNPRAGGRSFKRPQTRSAGVPVPIGATLANVGWVLIPTPARLSTKL